MPWYVWKNIPESINVLTATSLEEAIKEIGLDPEQVTEDNFEEYPYEGPGAGFGLLQGSTKISLLFVEKEIDVTKQLKIVKRKIREIGNEVFDKIEKEERRAEYLKLHAEFGSDVS